MNTPLKAAEGERQLLNVRQAAAFLGVHVSTIRRWAHHGKLAAVKVGSRGDWRFTKEDLLTMMTPVPAKAEQKE